MPGGHVHQEVERDRLLALGRAEEAGQQRGQLRPDPLDRAQRAEQRIEFRGTRHLAIGHEEQRRGVNRRPTSQRRPRSWPLKTKPVKTLPMRRRRLRYRAWHRGTREMDLILGPFADAHAERMDDRELDRLEGLMTEPTPTSSSGCWARNRRPRTSTRTSSPGSRLSGQRQHDDRRRPQDRSSPARPHHRQRARRHAAARARAPGRAAAEGRARRAASPRCSSRATAGGCSAWPRSSSS